MIDEPLEKISFESGIVHVLWKPLHHNGADLRLSNSIPWCPHIELVCYLHIPTFGNPLDHILVRKIRK